MRFLKTFSAAALALSMVGTAHAASWITGSNGPADSFRPLRYSASADQYAFSVTWPFEANADLVVYTSTDDGLTFSAAKTLTTDYTVTGAGDGSGGTLTFVAGHCDGTTLGCDADTVVIIWRNDGIARTTNFTTLTPTAMNLHLNRLVTQFQQTEDIVEQRAVQVPIDNDYSGSGFSPILPQVNESVEGHAITVEEGALGFDFSDHDLDDWGCLQCPDDDGAGECVGGSADGDACDTDDDCPGGDCGFGDCDGGTNDGNACASDEDCPGGGVCVDPGPLAGCDFVGVSAGGVLECNDDICPTACAGGGDGGCLDCGDRGFCTGGTNDGNPCTDDADCAGGGTCTFTNQDEVCFGGSGDGDACTDDADCPEGGTCRPNDNICFGGANDGDPCTDDADCPSGFCVDEDDICAGCIVGGGGLIAQLCVGGANDGYLCSEAGDCPGGTCGGDPCATCGGLCTSNSDCGGGCPCDVDNICSGGANDGDACTDDTDCPGTCTAAVCVENGGACTTNADCGGVCFPEFTDEVCQGGTNDGDPCTDDADCPGGGTCDTRDGVGVLGPDRDVLDNSLALWDGTSGKFITDNRVTVTSTGIINNVGGITFNKTGDLGTEESIRLSYLLFPTAQQMADSAAWYIWPQSSPDTIITDFALPAGAQMKWSSSGSTDPFYFGTTVTEWSPDTYPIVVFQPGVSTNSQLVARIYFTEDVVCPNDWAGSEVWNGTAFTGSKTYNIQKNGSTIGTAVFDTDAGPNEAVLLTSGAETNYAAGDYMDIDAPASADGTGADLSFSLKCYRSVQDDF